MSSQFYLECTNDKRGRDKDNICYLFLLHVLDQNYQIYVIVVMHKRKGGKCLRCMRADLLKPNIIFLYEIQEGQSNQIPMHFPGWWPSDQT